MPNLFEQLTGGRIIDLGSRLTPEEISGMAARPFRACPQCKGECVIGFAIGVDMVTGGMVVSPIPCDICLGEGEVAYVTDN